MIIIPIHDHPKYVDRLLERAWDLRERYKESMRLEWIAWEVEKEHARMLREFGKQWGEMNKS